MMPAIGMAEMMVFMLVLGAILYVYYARTEQQQQQVRKKKKGATRDAGIRELVRQGHISEAIDIYRDFTGVSTEEAAEDIAQIEQELALEEDTHDDDEDADTLGNIMKQ